MDTVLWFDTISYTLYQTLKYCLIIIKRYIHMVLKDTTLINTVIKNLMLHLMKLYNIHMIYHMIQYVLRLGELKN